MTTDWKKYAGSWKGEDRTVFGELAWKVDFSLTFSKGTVEGSGHMHNADDEEIVNEVSIKGVCDVAPDTESPRILARMADDTGFVWLLALGNRPVRGL